MPFVFRRTKTEPARIGTSRNVTIPTSPATLLVMNSGFMGWKLTNVGPSALTYGDSAVTIGTGDLQFYSVGKTYYPVADTMSLFVIADSVAGVVHIDEYL